MAKFTLPISSQYVSHWGIWEALREIIQNAKDEEDHHGNVMVVEHKGEWLSVSNHGADMGKDALLLGHTDKIGKGLRGQFGEGLDLALLAAVRDGHDVEVHTKSEVWRPSLQYAPEFNNNRCLTVVTRTKKTPGLGVMVMVKISEEDWLRLRSLFLFIDVPGEMIKTEAGSLLLEEKYRGQIYVKGIFVTKGKSPEYGFDLAEARLDRDRRMIDQWDLDWKLGKIVRQAMVEHPDRFATEIAGMLENDSPLVAGLHYQMEKGDAAVALMKKTFVDVHGETAIPVRSMAESEKMSHHGRKGVVVSQSMMSVLEKAFGSKYEIEATLKIAVTSRTSYHELHEDERQSLNWARACVSLQSEFDLVSFLDQLEVVTFSGPSIEGRADLVGGKIELSRHILIDAHKTLLVLIHELAHVLVQASDGTKMHVACIEEIWRATFKANLVAPGQVH